MIETFGPEALIPIEPLVGLFHRFGAQAARDGAAGLVANDEAGVREDVEMFHHRRQRHRERFGEFADRNGVHLTEARQQCAPCGVGESRESAVEIGFVIVNHLVKYRDAGPPVKGLRIVYVSLRKSP